MLDAVCVPELGWLSKPDNGHGGTTRGITPLFDIAFKKSFPTVTLTTHIRVPPEDHEDYGYQFACRKRVGEQTYEDKNWVKLPAGYPSQGNSKTNVFHIIKRKIYFEGWKITLCMGKWPFVLFVWLFVCCSE